MDTGLELCHITACVYCQVEPPKILDTAAGSAFPDLQPKRYELQHDAFENNLNWRPHQPRYPTHGTPDRTLCP